VPKALGWKTLCSLFLEFKKCSTAQVPGEAGLGDNHLPLNHWMGVQVFVSSLARAKQQLAIPWSPPKHLCRYSSAANIVWSPVDSQLDTDADPQRVQSKIPAKVAAGSLTVYTHPLPLSITTEVSGMVLTSDVPRYTHAALQLLSYLQHPSLHNPATPQLPAAVGDTQVTINIFANVQPAAFPGSEAPIWLSVQCTATLTTRLFEPGTSTAHAAPPSTALALQPSVQWTDLVVDNVFLYGMCLIEDTLVSNQSFTPQLDGAVLTGQFTLNAQYIDRYSNYTSSFTLMKLPSIAACCCRLHAAFDVTVTHVCLMCSCSCPCLNCETQTYC